MNLSWGVQLWDRLDLIVDHSDDSSNLIDKSCKCFIECRNVWIKAAYKQKRLLDKLQTEVNESVFGDFTMQACLSSIINNLTSICNIESTFQESVSKASEDFLKKNHTEIKKQSYAWTEDKQKMEDNLIKGKRRYDGALKRYREKYQAMITAEDNFKKSQDNRTLSRSQIDIFQNSSCLKRDEYEESKRDYGVEFTNFNTLQQTHFKSTVVDWAKNGEKLYEEKLLLFTNISNDMAKFTKEMIKNLGYSLTRFTEISEALSLEKDSELLIRMYKTGDVPPGELQFTNLDNKENLSKSSQNIFDSPDNPKRLSGSDKSTSSFGSNAGHTNESVYSCNYSSLNEYATTRPESGRPSVNNAKNKESGKGIRSEGRFSLRKSKQIFRSSVPWKESQSTSKPQTGTQKTHYKRNGRSTIQQSVKEQRSQSVTDMISNALRSSFHKTNVGKSEARSKKQSLSPAAVNRNVIGVDSSDFDTDSSYENNKPDSHRFARGTKSDMVNAPRSIEQSSLDGNQLGCCVSYHDFDSEDPSKKYLSFKAGDQFNILKMDDGSGWLFVETEDGKVRGLVPTSYMDM